MASYYPSGTRCVSTWGTLHSVRRQEVVPSSAEQIRPHAIGLPRTNKCLLSINNTASGIHWEQQEKNQHTIQRQVCANPKPTLDQTQHSFHEGNQGPLHMFQMTLPASEGFGVCASESASFWRGNQWSKESKKNAVYKRQKSSCQSSVGKDIYLDGKNCKARQAWCHSTWKAKAGGSSWLWDEARLHSPVSKSQKNQTSRNQNQTTKIQYPYQTKIKPINNTARKFKDGQRTWKRLPSKLCKCLQHHEPSGKCKSKPPWESTVPFLGWLL